jgi:23S rRNA (guanosine2251-2'-O)-methyltransferase
LSKNTMFLYGRNSVLERLKANPQSIRKIFLEENFMEPQIQNLISAFNISVERLSDKELAKIKPTKDLQGITAVVERFNYASFEDLLHQPKDKQPVLIFLDRISDPQNLGVIMRTTACFGGFAVVIPKFEACEVTEAVLHVASGGENYVPVSMVTNISQAVITAKKSGYWVVGALISDEAQDIHQVTLPFPLGVVFGSEGEGIRYGIQKHLDVKVRIPMQGAKLSFNVAMACAIFCFEISRQKGITR